MDAEAEELRAALEALEAESWDLYLAELRRADVAVEEVYADDWATPVGQFLRSDAAWLPSGVTAPDGTPYPSGAPLGGDESGSHIGRWWSLVRGDPCAFCDRSRSGTVDHIMSKRLRPDRQTHTWVNLIGACPTCNRSKSDKPMLLWMLSRVAPELKLRFIRGGG